MIENHPTHHSIQWEFSTRQDGDMRDLSLVRKFLHKHSFEEHSFVALEQIHDISVKQVTDQDRGNTISGTDGLVTSLVNVKFEDITLAIRTADCVPILFFDEKNKVIGACHSGWKGTYNNIVYAILQAMESDRAMIEEIHVLLGPHIRECCYDIPPERSALFVQRYGSECIVETKGKPYLSLQQVIVKQLQNCGISPKNITQTDQCTASNHDRYYSYRRDSHETFGEQIAIIGLKKVQSIGDD